MARNTEEKPSGPIQVEVIRLPEAVETLLKDMSERLRALEEREAKLRETVARLEAQVAAGPRPGGLMGAGAGPVVNPLATDPDTQEMDAGEFAEALGEQILAASDRSETFSIDDVTVEARGAFGHEDGRVRFATNARRQAESGVASKLTFSVRRRRETKIIE